MIFPVVERTGFKFSERITGRSARVRIKMYFGVVKSGETLEQFRDTRSVPCCLSTNGLTTAMRNSGGPTRLLLARQSMLGAGYFCGLF